MAETKTYGPPARETRTLMMFCIVLTLVAIFGLFLSQAIPGSPFGGPDAPALIGYFTLLGFLYIVLPSHVICGLVALVRYLRADQRRPFLVPTIYFIAWFSGTFLITVLSGTADPVFKEINDRRFRAAHEAEMSLLDALKRPGDHASVEELIANGAEVNLADPQFGMTPLLWAAKNSSAKIVKQLLDAGAEPNKPYQRTWDSRRVRLDQPSAVDLAAWSETEAREKVEILLATGANATGQAMVGACWTGNRDFIELLQNAGADPIGATDGRGMSCLHVAATNGDTALTSYLLEHGADPNAALKYKLRPLDNAIKNGHTTVATQLMQAGGSAHHERELIGLLLEASPAEYEALAQGKPLAHLETFNPVHALSRTVMSCELGNVRRLLNGGLKLTAERRKQLRVPRQCAEHDELVVLLGLEASTAAQ